VVDRFLSRKTAAAPARAEASCGCGTVEAAPSTAPARQPAAVQPPAPQVEVVGFVCEDDVRRARTQGKKIYINRKTIVTPAAKDLNFDAELLVMTE
jgi:hypothetical protein